MDRPRIGVIGVGHLGRAHVRVLSGIETCALIGCYDIVREKSNNAAREFSTTSFADVHDLIGRCDAVSVVVPTSEHRICALEVLRSHKHLFVEKPIASTIEEAREIVSVANSMDVKLMVGHIERFNPALKSLKGSITYPSFIEAHRLAPFNPRGLDVAVILDLMIHDIDLCLHLTGSEVTDIQASAAAVVLDKMDIANARLTFASGCTANLTASRISPKAMRKLRLFQPNGYISFDFREPSAELYHLVERDVEAPSRGRSFSMPLGDTGKEVIYNKPAIESYDMLTAELRSFIESIETGKPVAVSGEEALKALSTALDIERKAQAGLDNLRTHIIK